MDNTKLDIGFLVSAVLLAIGFVAWSRPLLVYRIGYKWTTFWVGSLISPGLRQDIDLLLNEPEQWRLKHRVEVQWTRYATGCGFLVMGSVILLIMTLELIAR